MALYKEWSDMVENLRDGAYIQKYYLKEAEAYKYILENKKEVLEGTVLDLSKELNLELGETAAFISGINESLKSEVDVDSLVAESSVKLEIDFEKLLWNMHKSKAPWLYELPEWDGIFDEEKRKQIKKDYVEAVTAKSNKVGRNDPCPCGSGKKYKKCCGK